MSHIDIATVVFVFAIGIFGFLLIGEKIKREQRERLWSQWQGMWERTAVDFAIKIQKSEPFSLEDVRIIRWVLLEDSKFRLTLFDIDDVIPMHVAHEYLLRVWKQFGSPPSIKD